MRKTTINERQTKRKKKKKSLVAKNDFAGGGIGTEKKTGSFSRKQNYIQSAKTLQ